MRARARSQLPNPKARKTSGAGLSPRRGCAIAAMPPEKLTVLLSGAAAGVSVAGLKLHAAPDGRPEQAKLIVELNPFTGVTVKVADAGAVPLAGLIVREKSAGGGAVIVTVTALDTEEENAVDPP